MSSETKGRKQSLDDYRQHIFPHLQEAYFGHFFLGKMFYLGTILFSRKLIQGALENDVI